MTLHDRVNDIRDKLGINVKVTWLFYLYQKAKIGYRRVDYFNIYK